MMQYAILLTFVCATFAQTGLRGTDSTSTSVDHIFEWKEFTNFQERFSKKYLSLEEMEDRFSVFRENFRAIRQHNNDLSQNFTMGVNQFTDLTPEEFKATYVTGIKSAAPVQATGCKSFSSSASSAPESFDWRELMQLPRLRTRVNVVRVGPSLRLALWRALGLFPRDRL